LKWHGHLGHEFARAGCPCHLELNQYLNFVPMRILAYCLMPNHRHLVLYPRADGDLSKFLRRITLTHTQRYQAKEKPSVWFGEMGVEGGGAIRPGKHDAESRPPERRFLTPFSLGLGEGPQGSAEQALPCYWRPRPSSACEDCP
jgi:hypothetical protein